MDENKRDLIEDIKTKILDRINMELDTINTRSTREDDLMVSETCKNLSDIYSTLWMVTEEADRL